MLKISRHQSKKKLMILVHILNIKTINNHIFLIDNVIYSYIRNLIVVGNVSLYIDFQKSEGMYLLHGAIHILDKTRTYCRIREVDRYDTT